MRSSKITIKITAFVPLLSLALGLAWADSAQATDGTVASKTTTTTSTISTTTSGVVTATSGLIATSPAESCDSANLKSTSIVGKPRIGLALGGGGMRGAAHVGVLRVLEKAGIKFDYVAGTSIGAVVGGFYCAGLPIDELQAQFENGKIMRKYMTIPLMVRVALMPVMVVPRIFGSHDYDGLYKGNVFRKFLLKELPVEDAEIEHLKIKYAAVALNLVDGKPYMITEGNLGYAMQASSAVPSLRKPVPLDGKLFVDGGVVCNLPVKQVREMGADFVVAVDIDEKFEEVPLEHFRHVGAVARRMVNWDLHQADKPQAMMADVDIHPNTDGIGLISTRKSDARKGIAAGELAAEAALPMIEQKLKQIGYVFQPTF